MLLIIFKCNTNLNLYVKCYSHRVAMYSISMLLVALSCNLCLFIVKFCWNIKNSLSALSLFLGQKDMY